jgi:dihydrofolate synthase/folylpolyglutamate synthase
LERPDCHRDPNYSRLTIALEMNQIQSNRLESLLGSLYSRINYERQSKAGSGHFKLQNMRRFLERLGNPHLDYPVVHVAGTKGKGSVTTLIGQILQASGRKTGVYLSPHLEAINQRMNVGGKLISDAQLEAVLDEIAPVADQLDQELASEGFSQLTFFEIITAAAFVFFKQQQADAVVLEVGLGGRLDSTNVCQPNVCVITNISLDHTRQLGSTLDLIAAEKAGIIKPGIPVVSGVRKPIAAEVFARVAAERQSPLFELEKDFHVDERKGNGFSVFGRFRPKDSAPTTNSFVENGQSEGGIEFSIGELNVSLLGRHQITNSSLAVAAIQLLNAQGWGITDAHVREGLRQARLPGRIEVVSEKPLVVLDIAHNVASVRAFVETLQGLDDWKSSRQKTLLFAASSDKDVKGILSILMTAVDKIVLTEFVNNPRAKSAGELLTIATNICDHLKRESASFQPPELMLRPTPETAWHSIVQNLGPNDVVSIAGSVFLIAEARPLLLRWAAEHRKISTSSLDPSP